RRRGSSSELAAALGANFFQCLRRRQAELHGLPRPQPRLELLPLNLAGEQLEHDVAQCAPSSSRVGPQLAVEVLGHVFDLKVRHGMTLASYEHAFNGRACTAAVIPSLACSGCS